MIDVALPPWLVSVFVFALGAVVGSFLNVCIYRIPQKETLWESLKGLQSPPSTCPRCRTQIKWYDNVPIFGWLWLRGRCRACRMRISIRYPAIELFNALLWVLIYRLEIPLETYGTGMLEQSCLFVSDGPQAIPGLGWLSQTAFVHLRFLFHIALVEALLVASFIDFDLRIIPDGVTVPGMIAAFAGAVAIGRLNLVPVFSQNPRLIEELAFLAPPDLKPFFITGPPVPEWIFRYPHLHGLAVAVAGFVVGGGLVWGVRLLGFVLLRREAMGFGDVTLMAMAGAFLGWQPTVVAFFLAPACALVAVILTALIRRDQYIPYGPYLSLGTLLTILGWNVLWPACRNVFELGIVLIPITLFMVAMLSLCLLLVQGVKWLLGFELYPAGEIHLLEIEKFLLIRVLRLDLRSSPEPGLWTAADQNLYQAGENADPHRGRWRSESEWPGAMAGRGLSQLDRWRGRS